MGASSSSRSREDQKLAPMGRSYGEWNPKKQWGRTCALPHVFGDGLPVLLLRWRSLAYAASALLAFSAKAAKPTASCTAMSASTLRSRVMPAFSMPFMKRL